MHTFYTFQVHIGYNMGTDNTQRRYTVAQKIAIPDEMHGRLKEIADKTGYSLNMVGQIFIARSLNDGYVIPSAKLVYDSEEDADRAGFEAHAERVADLIRPEPTARPEPTVDTLEKKIAGGKPLTKGELLKQIDWRKKELADDLEFCQDAETRTRLEAAAKEDLDSLWKLYHEAAPEGAVEA